MTGQGCPITIAAAGVSRADQSSVSSLIFRSSRPLLCAMLIATLVLVFNAWPTVALGQSSQVVAATEQLNLRLRLSLGGGIARRWVGNVSIDDPSAKLFDLSPRGLNSDANAAMQIEQGKVKIDHEVETDYNGIDVSVQASETSKLLVELAPFDQPDQEIIYKVRLSDLLKKGDHRDIDQTGNRCSILRVPGDQLTFEIDRPHLIFRPGERMEFLMAANRTSFVSTLCQCRFSVTAARRQKSAITPWNKSVSMACDETGSANAVAMSFDVPSDEGVYDLTFELQPSGFPTSLTSSFGKQPKLIRKVQFVVLADSVAPKSTLTFKRGGWKRYSRFAPEELMDSGNVAWPNPLTGSIAQLRTGKLGRRNDRRCYGNARRRLAETSDGTALQFDAGGWQAIPISAPAEKGPCLVEVDCLLDGEAALGISLLQFDAAGQVSSSCQDSGLVAQRSVIGNDLPSKQTFRLYHWPNESPAWLVLTNRHASESSKILDVRVLTGPDRIPVPAGSHAVQANISNLPTRGMMALLESPGFPENFGASEHVDSLVGQPLDDWVTFYEGVDRLIQHLKARNLAGAFVTVASDGSGLYPGRTLQPGPLYDTGCFQSQGNDPMRKDVVELMFKMFEREQLQLIPVVSLNGRLPTVDVTDEAALVDYNGETLPAGGVENLPRYNPLAPAVQHVVTEAIAELVNRYRHHESFRGVAITCRPDAVTLLPGQQWACDRATMERFLNATKIGDADRNRLRSHGELMSFLMEPHRETWLAWRATEMANFYRRLQTIVSEGLSDGKLYLAPIDLYRNAEIAAALNPGLHASSDYRNAMLRLGFDSSWSSENAENQSIVVLNPHRVAPGDSLASRRVEAHVAGLDQMNDLFRSRENRGDMFVHRDSWVHFAQLEQEPPFQNQQSPLVRRQQLLPVGELNRKRFAERLFAADSRMLVDSSWAIPVLEDDSLAEFGRVYSQLPSVNFQDVGAVDLDGVTEISSRSLPVMVRQFSTAEEVWFYAVNSSPWPIEVRMQLGAAGEEKENSDSGNSFESLSETLLDWALLEPFEEDGRSFVEFTIPAWSLVAGRSADPRTQLQTYSVRFPADADLQLKKQIYRLQSLLVRSTEATPFNGLSNPGFENLARQVAIEGRQPDGFSNPTPDGADGWTSGSANASETVTKFESTDAYEGSRSLRLSNSDETPVWIRSNEFSAPETGRLSVSAWLKTDQPDRSLPLRISLEGETGSGTYYRFGAIGSQASAGGTNQVGNEWQRFAVHFDDLPLHNLDRLRVGFDLMGPGSVMIDRVELFDRWFDENDSKAMTQLLATASTLLSTPKTYDRCRRLLESYWPRFLTEHFEETQGQLASGSRPSDVVVQSDGVTQRDEEASTKPRIRTIAWPIRMLSDDPADESAETSGSDESGAKEGVANEGEGKRVSGRSLGSLEEQDRSGAAWHESTPSHRKFRFRNVFTPRVPALR